MFTRLRMMILFAARYRDLFVAIFWQTQVITEYISAVYRVRAYFSSSFDARYALLCIWSALIDTDHFRARGGRMPPYWPEI